MASGSFDWSVGAAFASAVSAVAAAISAFLSFRSMRVASRISKEQRASQATIQFLDLSLKHKRLSTSDKGEDYEWYLIAVLEWAREVLIAYPDDPSRRNQVRQQLSYHRDELSDWMKDDRRHIADFGPNVLAVVEEVLKKSSKVGGGVV
jgi:hypothetical protein